jgi:hypothetical protein
VTTDAIVAAFERNLAMAATVPGPVQAADAWPYDWDCDDLPAGDIADALKVDDVEFLTGGGMGPGINGVGELWGGKHEMLCYSADTTGHGESDLGTVSAVGGAAWVQGRIPGFDGGEEIDIPGMDRAVYSDAGELIVISGPNILTISWGDVDDASAIAPLVVDALDAL